MGAPHPTLLTTIVKRRKFECPREFVDVEYWRINFDGGRKKGKDMGSLAVVERDWEGKVFDYHSQAVHKVGNDDAAIFKLETLGAYQALLFGIEKKLSRVLIEGDSKTVIDVLNENKLIPDEEYPALSDMIYLKNTFYDRCIARHVHREGNGAADALATVTKLEMYHKLPEHERKALFDRVVLKSTREQLQDPIKYRIHNDRVICSFLPSADAQIVPEDEYFAAPVY